MAAARHTAKPRFLLAHSMWDLVPVSMGLAHLGVLLGFFAVFEYLPVWAVLLAGLLYSYTIACNIESVSHNFTHNPYFKSAALNRMFSLTQSLAIGFSQQFYKTVHWRHHLGNSDRPNDNGETHDWYSIYAKGKDGEPEAAWRYALFGVLRGDNGKVYAEMGRNGRGFDVVWARFEHIAFVSLWVLGFIYNWRFMAVFLPSWYIGHTISNLVGYYEHYGANPDEPVAWGVSTYASLYNLLWLNNGYHAEHHYRPRTHWRDMPRLRARILEKQREKGVHVLSMAHYLGFLQPDRKSFALGGDAAVEHRQPGRHENDGCGAQESAVRTRVVTNGLA